MTYIHEVVIADDNEHFRRAIGRYMSRRHFIMLEAANGIVAKAVYLEHRHARVIISDMSMGQPHENGPALFAAVRAEVVSRGGIFIAMSGDFAGSGMLPVIEQEKQLPHSPLRVMDKVNFVTDLIHIIEEWESKLRTP